MKRRMKNGAYTHRVARRLAGRFGRDESWEAARRYFREISRYKLLTHEEVVRLARQIRRGQDEGCEARNKLVVHNLRLAARVAMSFQGRGVELMDLIGAANEGLMRAAELYDDRVGTQFSTYAVWWVVQSVKRAIFREAGTIRVPEDERKRWNKILDVGESVRLATGEEPAVEEAAVMLAARDPRIKVKYIVEAGRRMGSTIAFSLDEELPRGEGLSEQRTYAEFVRGDGSPSPETRCAGKEEAAFIYEAIYSIAHLLWSHPHYGVRNVHYFFTRYGLDDKTFRVRTLEETSRLVGGTTGVFLTRERVRQLVSRGWGLVLEAHGPTCTERWLLAQFVRLEELERLTYHAALPPPIRHAARGV